MQKKSKTNKVQIINNHRQDLAFGFFNISNLFDRQLIGLKMNLAQ